MKRFLFTLIILVVSIDFSYSQSTEITPGSILPNMTTAQRTAITIPKNGMLVFDNTTQSYWFRQSGAWVELPKGGDTNNYWQLNGTGGNVIKNTNSGGFWSGENLGLIWNSTPTTTAPVSGAGTRLMWIPSCSAFRVGTISGNEWNDDNIGVYSFATGFNNKATGTASTALGYETTASGDYSTAMGYSTLASGYSSTAMGLNTIANNEYSTAMGLSTIASGQVSTALGELSIASGYSSTAMGYNSTASGFFSTTMGYETTASGDHSTAMGLNTTAIGFRSTAIGEITEASGAVSTAMGVSTKASGVSSTAMGNKTVASGNSSIAMGHMTEASKQSSTAMGDSTTASGVKSTAMGRRTVASSIYSTAMGDRTTASGHTSTAMGYNTTASGHGSIAMGNSTTASGYGSIAMGNSTTASGDLTTAMGHNVSTNGKIGSFIIGDNNLTTTNASLTNQFIARFKNGYVLSTSATGASGVQVTSGSSSWSTISDSTKIENFLKADGEDFLSKLKNLKLGSWNYKTNQDKPERFYGPMAQEIFSAYGKDQLGTIGCDTLVSTLNMDGLVFIFAQALEKRTEDLNSENEALKAEIGKLKQNLEKSIVSNKKLEQEINTNKQENNARFAKLESLLINKEVKVALKE